MLPDRGARVRLLVETAEFTHVMRVLSSSEFQVLPRDPAPATNSTHLLQAFRLWQRLRSRGARC